MINQPKDEAALQRVTDRLWAKLVELPLHQVWYAQKGTETEKGKRIMAEKENQQLWDRLRIYQRDSLEERDINRKFTMLQARFESEFKPAVDLQKLMISHIRDLYR